MLLINSYAGVAHCNPNGMTNLLCNNLNTTFFREFYCIHHYVLKNMTTFYVIAFDWCKINS